MMRLYTTASLAASLFTLSAAQTSSDTTAQCTAAGFSQQQCGLCPYNPSSTTQCASFDAGFDQNLPDSGPIPTYKNADWPGFSILTQTNSYNATTIGPYTVKHYAAVPPGGSASIKFGATGGIEPIVKAPNTPSGLGQLRYFHFACANPDSMDPPVPQPCKITVTASCLATGATNATGPYKPFSASFNYDPATVDRSQPITRTGMAYQALDFASAYGSGQGIATPQQCSNYTFSAEGTQYQYTSGPGGNVVIPGNYPGPVLLLDDVLYNIFYTVPVTAPPPPVTCANQGIEWAYYNNTAGNNNDKTYSTFDPTAYKKVKPITSGTTSTAGGISSDDANSVKSIYGSAPNLKQSFFVLNHRGYIVAPLTGVYTFMLNQVDDFTQIWIGSKAYSGWTRSNENTETAYGNPTLFQAGYSNFSIGLQAGTYYPLRIMFAQGQGVARFEINVALPNGTVFLSSSSTNNPYLIRYSCDNTTAPAFAPFGSET